MFVVPVIDLQAGVVVRGVAGRREEYRPIASQLTSDPAPASVAQALAATFGFCHVYVADLTAIAGRSPDFAAYAAIARFLPNLMIDAGVADAPAADRLMQGAAACGLLPQLVVGLESLASPHDLSALLADRPSEQVVFSLDLKAGAPITRIAAWQGADPLAIATAVVELGIERMIVLDLADVGVGRGTGTLDLVARLHTTYPHLRLVAGGGVRGRDDLRQLQAAGCGGALVASALHDGRLTRADVANGH